MRAIVVLPALLASCATTVSTVPSTSPQVLAALAKVNEVLPHRVSRGYAEAYSITDGIGELKQGSSIQPTNETYSRAGVCDNGQLILNNTSVLTTEKGGDVVSVHNYNNRYVVDLRKVSSVVAPTSHCALPGTTYQNGKEEKEWFDFAFEVKLNAPVTQSGYVTYSSPNFKGGEFKDHWPCLQIFTESLEDATRLAVALENLAEAVKHQQ